MRKNGVVLAIGLVAIWAVFAAALAAKGALYLAKHEGDAMHLAEIVLRQAAGQWPHLDFMTPIGVLATAPIAAFVASGQGLGAAVLWAQGAVALALLPALWWVGRSRMDLPWALALGALCIALVTALVHGEAERSLSISMHYNRWAWALAFPIAAIAAIPPRQAGSLADGLVLGLGIAALALMKVTYVVALLPAVLAALALRRDGRAFVAALGSGLAVAVAVTLVAGPAFWLAYFGDLLAVARSGIRGAPGDSFGAVVAAPAYLGGSIVAVLGVILLRRAGQDAAGLVLLLLLPGFFFVTYQNYGNDPQWLYLLGILLIALRPSDDARQAQALALAGCAAFALGLPSAINLASSPFRHLTLNAAEYRPMLAAQPEAGALMFKDIRAETVTGRVPLSGFGKDDDPATLNGETLAECQLHTGTIALYTAMAAELEDAGAAGRALLTADLFNAFWLFGDFPPLAGGTPWYYGDLPGGDAAELLVVPTCPVLLRARRAVLDAIAERGWTLAEIARAEHWILLSIVRDQDSAAIDK